MNLRPETLLRSMRIFALTLLAFGLSFRALADDIPADQLPAPVLDTIKRELAAGTIRSAEVYDWGNTKIYRVDLDLKGVPDLELQIAENGKLVRSDSLRPEDEDGAGSGGSGGSGFSGGK